MQKARERIVRKVKIDQVTGCWEWVGNARENGYCRTSYKKVNWYLHRLSYAAFVGEIPNGVDVFHHCDNRKCCNPSHLFCGTRLENMRDAVKKGRQAKGFLLPQTKLSELDIADIVKKSLLGLSYKTIADEFNVTPQSVGKVLIKKGIRKNGISK